MSKKILLCALMAAAGAPMAMAQTAAVIVNKTTTTTTTSTTAAVVVAKPVAPATTKLSGNIDRSCTTPPVLADVPPLPTPSVDAGRRALGLQNFALARANFQPLADKGDAAGEGALGQLLLLGCTGMQDKDAGLQWMAKGADGGDTDTAMALGDIYLQGKDEVPVDDNKAMALIGKAAASGIMVAQTDLAYMYLNGRGTPVDKYQGMVWAVKAGEQGSPASLNYIANAYYKGAGLPKDTAKALYYVAVAYRRGDAAQKIAFKPVEDNIVRDMQNDDVRNTSQESLKWIPGAGSLSEVLRDAGKWRDQQPRTQAKN